MLVSRYMGWDFRYALLRYSLKWERLCVSIIYSNFKDEEFKIKLKNILNRAQLTAVTLCLSASLGMSIFLSASSPFIGLMFATITAGVYVTILSGKWSSKNT